MGNLESRLFVFSMVFYNLIAHVSCPGESRVRMYCDFEKDMCSWRHETQYTGGLKWHHSEPNPVGCDKQLCPYYNDRYLYVTSNHLVRNGSFVRISHYPLNAQVTGECSLTMKYIAHGVGFAKLVIGIRMIGYREPESILVIYSSRATDWYQVKVPLIASYVFTPVIEAVRSSDLSSDGPSDGFIAVDDVVLSEGCLTRPDEESNFDSGSQNAKNSTETVKANLEEIFGDQGEQEESELPTGLRQLNYEQASIPNEPSSDLVVKNMTHYVDEFESLPKPLKSVSCKEGELCEKIPLNCSDPEFRCNFIKDCEDGTDELSCPHSCNLDEINDQEQFKQLCGWSQSQQGTKYGTWVLISSIYASKYFENYPRTDANLGTKLGKYLILNVIKSSLIPAIHLNSPTFFSAKNTCYFTFSYIIYDQSAVFYITLTVEPDKITNHRGMSVSLLWKSNLLATPASRWRNASAYIGQQSDPFYLTFVRSSAPYSSHGTIALDNLKFRAC